MSEPFSHVQFALKAAPGISEAVNKAAQTKILGNISWPDWCFLPIAGWQAAVNYCDPHMPRFEQAMFANLVAAPLTWRLTQGIYAFDPIVAEELLKTEFAGKIPSQALLRLPEWCPFIRVPPFKMFDHEISGMFVMLEYDAPKKRTELRMYLDDGTYELLTIILYLGDWTVDEAIEYFYREAEQMTGPDAERIKAEQDAAEVQRYKAEMIAAAKRLLPLVLYLCTDSPEIENTTIPEWLPQNPQPKKIRGEIKFMPAKKVHRYLVGSQLGKELKEARITANSAAGTHTITPHVRRAHWHGYWTGPRKGKAKTEQVFSLRWLPPIMVTSRHSDNEAQ